VTGQQAADEAWRDLAPQIVTALLRRTGDFGAAEDAVQEALLAAATQWPREGTPDDPKSWLVTVASRRLIDQQRRDHARRRREVATVTQASDDELVAPAADADAVAERDDTLALLLLCCHPSLTPPSQVALTLRAVGGLTTVQIAKAFLVPESTMAQRISRAKQTIRDDGARFHRPSPTEQAERLPAVLHVLYLIFNEGYTSTAGPDLHIVDLTREAIRLTRAARSLLPDDGEVAGLLALMLITDARRAARTGADGGLVPLAEQDRRLWDVVQMREGTELVKATLSRGTLGAYQVQAAIAAVHAEATTAEATDWRQIVGLYQLLERLAPGPIVTLNHAVALGMAFGPRRGLDLLRSLQDDVRLTRHHRLHAVRAHLLELAGDTAAAIAEYDAAARLTTSMPEQRYLQGRASRLRSTA
jgi:RNA polymerase sigma factor (sigma-70 family)